MQVAGFAKNSGLTLHSSPHPTLPNSCEFAMRAFIGIHTTGDPHLYRDSMNAAEKVSDPHGRNGPPVLRIIGSDTFSKKRMC